MIELLSPTHISQPVTARLLRAKRAYTTRRVPLAAMSRLVAEPGTIPRPGDLLLARVERVGKHAHLEGVDGRRSALFVGDEIVVCCAARYAPDQFDADMPGSLSACHLVAGGGVAGVVRARHAAVGAPTEIVPLGLIADATGHVANLADHAMEAIAMPSVRRPITIASLGTSMNAGKTTSAAYLIRGLVRAGMRVGAAKVTGTGSGNDPGLLRDAGAALVLDFTDAGHASTCNLNLACLLRAASSLVAHLSAARVDAVVLEVADGLFQRETSALLGSPGFAAMLDGVLFSSNDAMGAAAGAQWLRERALPLLAMSGTVTRSPLARQEAAQASCLPVLGLDELGSADIAKGLWMQAAERRTAGAAA